MPRFGARPRTRSSRRFRGKPRRRIPGRSSWHTKQGGQKLACAGRTSQVQRNRSAIRADGDGERQEATALPLCVDGSSDVGKDPCVRGKVKAKTIGKFC